MLHVFIHVKFYFISLKLTKAGGTILNCRIANGVRCDSLCKLVYLQKSHKSEIHLSYAKYYTEFTKGCVTAVAFHYFAYLQSLQHT